MTEDKVFRTILIYGYLSVLMYLVYLEEKEQYEKCAVVLKALKKAQNFQTDKLTTKTDTASIYSVYKSIFPNLDKTIKNRQLTVSINKARKKLESLSN